MFGLPQPERSEFATGIFERTFRRIIRHLEQCHSCEASLNDLHAPADSLLTNCDRQQVGAGCRINTANC